MADAYGMMIINQSENIVCNFDELVDSLNSYRWNNCGTEWMKNEILDGRIPILMNCHGYDKVQYPSVFPDELKGVVLKDQDGNERFIEDPTEEEFDDHWDVIYDNVPLGKLAKDISKHIKVGEIEISSVCNEKHRYVQMDRLVIRSNGSAYRRRSVVGNGYNEDIFEEFNGKE
jgi:hypothetical protein